MVALIGTNRGLASYSMAPWIVAAAAKLANLVMESIYGAVGHYTLFIVSLVFSHWGAPPPPPPPASPCLRSGWAVQEADGAAWTQGSSAC